MKIQTGENNKIENSNVGQGNSYNNSKQHEFWKIIIEILVGIIVAVVGGYILFRLNWN